MIQTLLPQVSMWTSILMVLAGSGTVPLNRFSVNVSRPDVDTTKGITGNHGFVINLSSYISDGKPHSLYIYPIDTTSGLGSPSNPLNGVPQNHSVCCACC